MTNKTNCFTANKTEKAKWVGVGGCLGKKPRDSGQVILSLWWWVWCAAL